MWLQRRPRETLQLLVRDFLQAYQLLAQKAVEDGRLLRWAVRPKMHYLDEAVSDHSKLHLNPKVTACWASEMVWTKQEFHQESEVRPSCHPAWPATAHCVLAGALPRQARIFSTGDECD